MRTFGQNDLAFFRSYFMQFFTINCEFLVKKRKYCNIRGTKIFITIVTIIIIINYINSAINITIIVFFRIMSSFFLYLSAFNICLESLSLIFKFLLKSEIVFNISRQSSQLQKKRFVYRKLLCRYEALWGCISLTCKVDVICKIDSRIK